MRNITLLTGWKREVAWNRAATGRDDDAKPYDLDPWKGDVDEQSRL